MTEINTHLDKGDPKAINSTKAFQAISHMWEEYPKARLKGVHGPKPTFGRGQPPQRKHTTLAATVSGRPDTVVGEDLKLKRHRKTEAIMRDWAGQARASPMQHNGVVAKKDPQTSQEPRHIGNDLQDRWTRIATKSKIGLKKAGDIRSEDMPLSNHPNAYTTLLDALDPTKAPDTPDKADALVKAANAAFTTAHRERKQQKLSNYKGKHRQGKALAKASYNSLKDAPLPPVTHLPVDGEGSRMAPVLPELHELPLKPWNVVYNR